MKFLILPILFLSLISQSAPLTNNLSVFATWKSLKQVGENFEMCTASTFQDNVYISFHLNKKSIILPVDVKKDFKLDPSQTTELNAILKPLLDENGRQIHTMVSGDKDTNWEFHTKAKDSPSGTTGGSVSENALKAINFINSICKSIKK